MQIPRRVTYLIPVVIGLVLTASLVAGLYADRENYTQKLSLDIFYRLSSVQSAFEKGLNTRAQVAEAIRVFVSLNPDLSQIEFSEIVRGLVSNSKGVRRVELIHQGHVSHAYPEGVVKTLGMSLENGFPVQVRSLAANAKGSGRRQISRPLPLLGNNEVIVVTLPIYRREPPTLDEGEFWGVILAYIDCDTLYQECGIDRFADLDMTLRDPGDVHGRTEVFHGPGAIFDDSPVVLSIPVPGGYWQLGAVPAGGWPESPNKNVILYGGGTIALIIILLLFATLYLMLKGLREREKYRYLVQNAKSIILRIDMAGNITFCNEHALRFFGFSADELLGQPLVGTLFPERSVDGESMKRFVHMLLRYPSAQPFNETLNVRRNGEMVWVAWASEPVRSGDGAMIELLCVGTDITDRKIMEDAWRQSERQYRMLAENVTDVIIGLDADWHYTYVSPSDEMVRGYARNQVLGRPFVDCLTANSGRVFLETMGNLSAKKGENGKPPSVSLDLEFYCTDDRTAWLETRFGLLLNDDGELIGAQGVGRDISDRRRMEALRDDVERMARHDLKTPLGAVIGLPDEIKGMGNLDKPQEMMLDTIRDAGESMLELVNRSLDLFKMETGSYELDLRPVNLLEELESINNETRALAREKGISIGVEVLGSAATEPFIILVERPLFRSMLSNLMLNALQASPSGGTISVSIVRGHKIGITIRNKGAVPDGLRETFFDKYSTSRKREGAGLGTYSARLIARTHGGDIAVDTSVRGETGVTITLPS